MAAADGDANDWFGYRVGIDGGTVVVGAPFDEDPNGASGGSAYVFERADGEWVQRAKVAPADGSAESGFGSAVTLSGETAVATAPFEPGPEGDERGAAYVLERQDGEWTRETRLEADDGEPGDRFGRSVAMAGDRLLVGARKDDNAGGRNAGAAYVFEREEGEWSQEAKIQADDAGGEDYFGNAVALSGEAALVCAESAETSAGSDFGAAYVFERDDGEWTQGAKLTAGGVNREWFAFDGTLSGDTALIGAPLADRTIGTAYVFERTDGEWTQAARLRHRDANAQDRLGWAVALDGDRAFVGAQQDDDAGRDAGSVTVFERADDDWDPVRLFAPSALDGGEAFGGSIALSDGTLVVGAARSDLDGDENAGAAYLYE